MNNDFSIKLRTRKKSNNNWMWELELPPINNKRNRKTKSGFKTKKEAIANGEEAKKEYEKNPNFGKKSSLTVSQLLDIWYKDYCLVNLKESTYIGYKKKFNKINNELGAIPVRELKTLNVQRFINKLAEEKTSRNSLTVYKGILTNSLNFAINKLEIINNNEAKNAELPKKRSETAKKAKTHPHCFLEDGDTEKILQRFPEGSSAHIPIVLCLRAGLRRGEAFGLTWSDINFKTKTINIRRQLQWSEKNHKWYISEPKYESFRKFKLDNKTIALLKRTKKEQEKNKSEYGDRYVNYYIDDNNIINITNGTSIEFINVRENGELITSNIVEHTSRIIKNELGITKFTMHSLRHTNATKLIENGATLKAVQYRLGHRNMAETLDIYTHCSQKMEDEAVEIANAIY